MKVAKRYKYMYTVLNVFCCMSTLSIQVCTECNKFNCIHAKRYKYMYTVLNVFCCMSTLSTQVCTECNKFNCIHVDTVDTCIFSCS